MTDQNDAMLPPLDSKAGVTVALGQQVYALFIDIMGFADAIDSLTESEHEGLDEALRNPANWPKLPPRAIDVASSYSLFHNELEDHVSTNRLHIDSAMIFSDSAYIISPHFWVVLEIARAMMTFGYGHRIPLREGIGFGNFARLVFSTASHPSGVLVADSPFLGSAIVRAYRAERCRAKGFRIFLHPPLAVTQGPPWVVVAVPEAERSECCEREVNFLHESVGVLSSASMLAALRAMRIGVQSPRVLLHYDASEQALRRLHEAGEAHGWRHTR